VASSIRSFVAVEPGVDISRSINRLTRQLSADWPEYRWVNSGNLHLTVNFLGDVPDGKIPGVCEILRQTAARHPRFRLRLAGLGAFPRANRPRVIWAAATEGQSELCRIHYDLAEQLQGLRLKLDHKTYRPHLTLGRIRDRQRWSDSMIEYLQSEPDVELGEVMVEELILFASHLEKTGAVHSVMDRAALA
jgi:2'-5' RNA ligase